jgi:hypothetical protein
MLVFKDGGGGVVQLCMIWVCARCGKVFYSHARWIACWPLCPRIQMTARIARLHRLNELNTPCSSCVDLSVLAHLLCIMVVSQNGVVCSNPISAGTLSPVLETCDYLHHRQNVYITQSTAKPPMLVACYFHWICLAHEAEIHPSLAMLPSWDRRQLV